MRFTSLSKRNLIELVIPGAVWVVFLLSSPISAQDTIEDTTCLECHEGMNETLAGTSHRLSSEIAKPVATVACISCHDGAPAHIQDPSKENITNPADLSGHDAVKLCTRCHAAHSELDNFGFDVHAVQEMKCGQCHKVHGTVKGQLLDDKAEFCLRCHAQVRTKFSSRSNHPVLQGNITCLSCHRFVKRQDDRLAFDLAGVCKSCHQDKSGPFPYEHEATMAYTVEGNGCTECHEPHGSENDHLLKQSGNHLCKGCHIEHVTRNHGALWDKVWSNYSCQTCHTQTHGSFAGNLFLDPNLPARMGGQCYNTGCHSPSR